VAQVPVVVGPPRRRWPRRILIGLNIVVAFGLVATAGAYGYLKFRFGQIDRLSIAGLRGDDNGPERPMNVLFVGSDSRKNISKAEQRAFGTERQVGGERSDTIIVLHVDPKAEKAAILSIPRDLLVPIAGTNRQDKINAAFVGGPERLIATIKGALEIEIDHYVEVDFNSFRGIVDSIGGVKVYFPAPARDRYTGLNVRTAGCVQLDGHRSLQYVRSRHYQYYESGRWREDVRADLGRIERQQDFIRRVMHKAVRAARNPATLNSLIANAVDDVTIDDKLSTKDITRLAKRFRSLEPDRVDMVAIPTTQTRYSGAAVLRMKQPDADEVLARFRNELAEQNQPTGPTPKIHPSTVRVRVLNGTGTPGQAGQATTGLRQADFAIAGSPGEADRFTYRRTLIRYAAGQADKARLLQAYLPGGAVLQQDRTLTDTDLALVTGDDYEGVRPPAGAHSSTKSTATTRKPSTTATTASTATSGKPKSTGAPAAAQC
jgi:LCP family protein required for cell wall assembly